jgi:hypothetical protein
VLHRFFASSLHRFIGEPQPSPCLILGTPELAGNSAIDRDSSRELGHGLGSRRLQKLTERLGGTRLGGSDGGGCKGLLFIVARKRSLILPTKEISQWGVSCGDKRRLCSHS